MQFLTKSEIRQKLEEFLEGYEDSNRITYSEDWDKEFIHIGQPIEKTISQHQTFLSSLLQQKDKHNQALIKAREHDKDVRQGNFRS